MLLAAIVVLCAIPATADARALRVLVTGDSMMLLTDRYLKGALEQGGRAHVRTDIHVSTGLSKPDLLDWTTYAERQVERRPAGLVIATMGANDGYPIRGARCCGARWIARYATRARRVMRAWSQDGTTRVLWLTLPAPDDVELGRQFDAVNRAVIRAAAPLPGVGVVDLRPIITPTGRFQSRMAIDGVEQQIRSDDGVHLWWPGARLAADAILARLRADGAIV